MDVAVLSLSKTGSRKASELVCSSSDLEFHAYCLRIDDSISESYTIIEAPVSQWIKHLFYNYSAIVLVMPVGIAVRMIAPFITSKHEDPAVVCVDDGGNFAISILSGHLGGADELATRIGHLIQAKPVVTSSSAVLNKPSVDLIGREYSWKIESSHQMVTAVSAEVINDSSIGIFQDAGDSDWINGINDDQFQYFEHLSGLISSNVDAAIIITDKIIKQDIKDELMGKMNCVVFRPPVLHLGIGCRKVTNKEDLLKFTSKILQDHGLSISSVASVSTIDLKQQDTSIQYVAASIGVPLNVYTTADIEELYEQQSNSKGFELGKSINPKRLIGVWGVAEPTAILSSCDKNLLVKKHKSDDATIAVAR